jgi:hypothetical protein
MKNWRSAAAIRTARAMSTCSGTGTEGEENRRIWVARSTDDGKTFAPEKPAFDNPTGACGCCGMSAFADRNNNVYALYRSATEVVHRDIYPLYSNDWCRQNEPSFFGSVSRPKTREKQVQLG